MAHDPPVLSVLCPEHCHTIFEHAVHAQLQAAHAQSPLVIRPLVPQVLLRCAARVWRLELTSKDWHAAVVPSDDVLLDLSKRHVQQEVCGTPNADGCRAYV